MGNEDKGREEGEKIFEMRRSVVDIYLHKINKAMFSCLFCGTRGKFMLMGYHDMTTVIPLSKTGLYYPSYTLSCGECGFVHTFDEGVVDRIVGIDGTQLGGETDDE